MIDIDELIGRARGGDGVGALAEAERRVAAVALRAGSDGPEHGEALFEQSMLLFALGLHDRAIEVVRRACRHAGDGAEHERARLTWQLNLGDYLAAAERFDEALAVHEEALPRREKLYGAGHPGYAFGLDSWGEIALALGRFDEAAEAFGKAVAIYRAHGHERYFRAVLLQLLSLAGPGGPLAQVEMPGELASRLLRDLSKRRVPVAVSAAKRVVEVLERVADDDDAQLDAYLKLQQDARAARDHEVWAAALERIRALGAARDDEDLQLRAELGLGLCFDDAAQVPEASDWYDRAVERAERVADGETRSMTLRNAGLFHVHRADASKGLRLLRAAVLAAPSHTLQGALSRIALGIRVQHDGGLDEARSLLETGLALVDSAHPDALAGRSHLEAIVEARSCGCGDTRVVIVEEVERAMRGKLPPALREVVSLGRDGENLVARRPLDAAEARTAADALALAREEVRARIRDHR